MRYVTFFTAFKSVLETPMTNKWKAVPPTIARYRVPAAIVAASVRALRDSSAGEREWVILWLGTILDESTAAITRIHVPRQDSGPLHFNISIEERLRLLDLVAAKNEFVL